MGEYFPALRHSYVTSFSNTILDYFSTHSKCTLSALNNNNNRFVFNNQVFTFVVLFLQLICVLFYDGLSTFPPLLPRGLQRCSTTTIVLAHRRSMCVAISSLHTM